MDKPLISIITPSFNQGEYIGDTIRSVLNQTYDSIEYLIMDGGSTDSTRAVISRYRNDRRLLFYSEQDKGQYDAVNRGFLRASGDILGWINADDMYANDALTKISKVFQGSPDAEIVYGRLYSFKKGQETKRRMFCRDFSYRWLRRYCYTNPSVTFIRRSVVDRGGFLIDTSVPTYGDWDWYLRMAKYGKKFIFLDETLGYFRLHAQSRIMRMDQRQSRIERKMIEQRHGIPLSYMSLWVDNIIPWTERLDNFFILLKQNKWQEIAARFASASGLICRGLWHKMI